MKPHDFLEVMIQLRGSAWWKDLNEKSRHGLQLVKQAVPAGE
jgi:hypothetical protein